MTFLKGGAPEGTTDPVDLEIFIIFVVCANHENKKDKVYFTRDNHYSQNIFVRTVSHHIYSWLFRVRRSLLGYQQVTRAHGKRATTFFSVSDKSSVFTATVRAYVVIRFPFAR